MSIALQQQVSRLERAVSTLESQVAALTRQLEEVRQQTAASFVLATPPRRKAKENVEAD